ncbi:hypothetical protein BKA62DRAFT_831876 [Auriculariales sp. MPI-PUGE-AT-0066]|nr:hypothetical protein BKA62DRAFT_831876 [Auriculariales sp. MPI-PUGE-AT-0066]
MLRSSLPLPNELVHEIITWACTVPDDLDAQRGKFIKIDRVRERAPFDLGRVCRTWRSITLVTAEIWRYIDVPFLDPYLSTPDVKHVLRRVQLKLDRSRATSVHVVISCLDSRYLELYEPVLALLQEHRVRFRNLVVYAAGINGALLAAKLVAGPTPVLNNLQLICQEVPDDDPFYSDQDHHEVQWVFEANLNFLPNAPVVTSCMIANITVNDSTFMRGDYPKLESFEIGYYVLPPVWKFMSAHHGLRHLSIQLASDLEPRPPPEERPVKLHQLHSLRASETCFSLIGHAVQVFDVPALRELTLITSYLEPDGISPELERFFTQVGMHLTRLDMHGFTVYEMEDVTTLSLLSALQSARFERGYIYPAFFATLSSTTASMWPHLEYLTLDTVSIVDDGQGSYEMLGEDVTLSTMNRVVNLARARATPQSAQRGASAGWKRLFLKIDNHDPTIPTISDAHVALVKLITEAAARGDPIPTFQVEDL